MMASISLSRRTLLSWAAAAPAFTGAAIAQTPTDQMAVDFVALFEPGINAHARRTFHERWFSAAGLKRRPLADFGRYVETATARSGGLDLVSVSRTERGLRLLVRARRQGVSRTLRLRMDRDDASKIFDVSEWPDPTPYDGPVVDGPLAADVLAALIERRVRFAVERDEYSGAIRVVAPSGSVVYEAAFGYADKALQAANTSRTRFHLGSADKSFTALIVARLVQDGRLSWEAPLNSVLPDYPNSDFAAACTIRDLARHSSGLGALFDRPKWDKLRPHERMDDLFYAFAAEPPAFAPGSAAAYSNEGFIVLGAVAERVTGRSWYDLLADWIYAPASMNESGHFHNQNLPVNVARGYRYVADDYLGLDARRPNTEMLGYRGNSCGGGYATVGDMTSYLAALRSGALIAPAALDEMIVPSKPGIPDYGLGFIVRAARGRRIIGHGGGGPHSGIDGMSAIIWETGWAFSILGNFDAPFAGSLATDVGDWLSLQT